MSLSFNKIFTCSIITILVLLQIKHGMHLSNTSYGLDYDTLLAASPAILSSSASSTESINSEGYNKLELKYQEVLHEIKSFRQDVEYLKKAALLRSITDNVNTATTNISTNFRSVPNFPKENVDTKSDEKPKKKSDGKSKKEELNKDVEFSACLLIKDENHNIPEWLAYHYYMIRLRHLVVCLDPFSESSPEEIFQLWTNHTSLKIDFWTERKFFQPSPLKKLLNANDTDKIIYLHRKRQAACYSKCMKHLKENKKSTWTMFIDVDEYLTFNSVADDDSKTLYKRRGKKDNPYPRYEFTLPKSHRLSKNHIELMEARTRLPTGNYHFNYKTNLTISDFIKQEKNNIPWKEKESPCIVLPRLQFSDADESNTKILQRGIIDNNNEFEAKNFSTLRFFQHGRKGSITQNKYGKSIVDVSRAKKFHVQNPHSLTKECGGDGSAKADYIKSQLRVNHYLMPKEFFFSKVDPRRNEDMHKDRASVNSGKSYEMQGWLNKFIDDIGSIDIAKSLLKGAGEYIEYKGTRDFFPSNTK